MKKRQIKKNNKKRPMGYIIETIHDEMAFYLDAIPKDSVAYRYLSNMMRYHKR